MEQRANGRADHGHDLRSYDTDRPTRVCCSTLPIVPQRRRKLPRYAPQLSDDPRPPRRAIPTASVSCRRPWFLGPLIAWGLASLLGCAGPAGFPALLSVAAILPGGSGSGSTPVMASSLAVVTTAAAEAATLAATPIPAAPLEAPEAGQRLAALAAPRRAPQPLASLFLAMADVVRREVRAQAPAVTPTALAVEAAAAVESSPPERIRSQAIDLDIAIVPVGWRQVVRDGKTVSMWDVGSNVASWHKTSAMPGQPGNMVITGHNNIEGSVFRRIPDLREGDEVVVEAGGQPYTYTVESMFAVQEKGATPEQKAWNGQWIGAFPDERLTLVTCYPPDGNSHRMIVIAKPAAR